MRHQRIARELSLEADSVYHALHVVSGFLDKAVELLAHKNYDCACNVLIHS